MKQAQLSITLDDLAAMVKTGFDGVDKRLDSLEQGQTSLASAQAETNKRLAVLEDGQGQIKLRLDNVAYRFEINELSSRVDRVEHKLGLI